MGDYFKPLRRKIGVVTLTMACVFTGDWVMALSIPHNDDVFGKHDPVVIPLTLLSAWLLLSKPRKEESETHPKG